MKNKKIDNCLEEIIDIGDYPSFMTGGDNDKEGNQIFTPEFVCNDMFNMIGMDYINDIHKTVLEPASGDGAFTVRILDSRLKSILDNDNYFQKSLIALSTIFSIEMDKELIIKQRNNIYTVLMLNAKEKGNVPEGYEDKAKEIISTNFIWGETNIDSSLCLYGDPIGWYMPSDKSKVDKNKIKFANWNITKNIIDSTYILEEWESGQEKEDYSSLGGLFADE